MAIIPMPLKFILLSSHSSLTLQQHFSRALMFRLLVLVTDTCQKPDHVQEVKVRARGSLHKDIHKNGWLGCHRHVGIVTLFIDVS